MEPMEDQKRKASKGKNPEYTVRITYGTEELEICIRNLLKAMTQKEELHGEGI